MLRNRFGISRASGFIPTIAGLAPAVWFFQAPVPPGPAAAPTFVLTAITAAMIILGVCSILKSNTGKSRPETGKE